MRIRPRRPLRWILGGVAVAIALAFAGPYAYIHFVAGEAPAALAASASTAVQPATGTVAGNWQVTDGSQAGYRVEEVLTLEASEVSSGKREQLVALAVAAGAGVWRTSCKP